MRELAVNKQTRPEAACTAVAEPARSKTQNWWQWPNRLALDAPTVALVWLCAFAKSASETVQWPVALGLFLAVWCIYLADRLIDARCLNDISTASDRHRFARRHWRCLMILFSAIGITGIWLALTRIDENLLRAVGTVLLLVGLYFAGFVRLMRDRPARTLPAKEVACGLVFAIGCALGVDSLRESPRVALPMVLALGAVCALNCLLISAWEKSCDRNNDPASASRWWKALNRDLIWIGAIVTGVCIAGTFANPNRDIFLALSGSGALLTLLHLSRNFGWSTITMRRVLADAVLLTPIIFHLAP